VSADEPEFTMIPDDLPKSLATWFHLRDVLADRER
jgi:hypothetical protein